MIYTVTFNPAIDYVVHTDEMKVGCVNRSQSEQVYFGGKGINVSMVLSELDIKSKALGFVADKRDIPLTAHLHQPGVL